MAGRPHDAVAGPRHTKPTPCLLQDFRLVLRTKMMVTPHKDTHKDCQPHIPLTRLTSDLCCHDLLDGTSVQPLHLNVSQDSSHIIQKVWFFHFYRGNQGRSNILEAQTPAHLSAKVPYTRLAPCWGNQFHILESNWQRCHTRHQFQVGKIVDLLIN